MEDQFSKFRAMNFPRQVLAGHGVLDQIGSMCREFELKGTCLIATGPTTRSIAGERVQDVLEDARYEVQASEVGEATRETVDHFAHLAREVKAAFLLGVGGGTKIDIAKLASKQVGVPFISVPTSASHDGIASPRASIKDDGGSKSIEASVPLGIVADTSVIVKAPYRLLASGCADVISNSTAILDWKLAERLRNETYSTSAATLSEYTAETIIENAAAIKPNLEDSVWLVIRPIIISGIAMAVAGSSRPTSGSEHMFSHALDQIVPGRALHGEQCGVGSIMMMYLHGGDWQRLRTALQLIGAPTSAKELGLSHEQIIDALVHAHEVRRERYTILGDQGLTPDAAERLATITKVI